MAGGQTMDRLRQTVEAAVSGPWFRYGNNAVGIRTGGGNISITGSELRRENAEFIATFDPVMVSALLDIAERAEVLRKWAPSNTAGAVKVDAMEFVDLMAALDRLDGATREGE